MCELSCNCKPTQTTHGHVRTVGDRARKTSLVSAVLLGKEMLQMYYFKIYFCYLCHDLNYINFLPLVIVFKGFLLLSGLIHSSSAPSCFCVQQATQCGPLFEAIRSENLATFVLRQIRDQFGVRIWGKGVKEAEAARQQSHRTHLEVITEPVMLSDSYRLKHCLQCLKWI